MRCLRPGPHNLKVCLAYKEVGKCACLYKSSKFALFFSNVPAEWTFSRCALQIICRMLRIVDVWARRTSQFKIQIYISSKFALFFLNVPAEWTFYKPVFRKFPTLIYPTLLYPRPPQSIASCRLSSRHISKKSILQAHLRKNNANFDDL